MLNTVLMIFGAFGLILGLRGVVAGLRQSRLPTAEGRVLTKEIRQVRESTRAREALFEAHPTYEFEVNGAIIIGETLSPNEMPLPQAEALARVRELPERTTVYYDAADPSRCFLERDPVLFAWLTLFVGCASLFLGLGGFITGL